MLRRGFRWAPVLSRRAWVGVSAAGVVVVATGSVALAAMAGSSSSADAANRAPSAVVEPVVEPVVAASTSPSPSPRPLPPLPSTVGRLTSLLEPDAFVQLKHGATPKQLAAVHELRFVTGVTLVDAGEIRVEGRPIRVLGVDPATFRAFTPGPTASSDALWQSLARGELTLGYDVGISQRALGRTVRTRDGQVRQRIRLGAFAAVGLPHAGALLAHRPAIALGVHRNNALILSAPQADAESLSADLHKVFGDQAEVELLGRFALDDSPSSYTGGRPRTYRQLYQAAAKTCPGLSWTVLAAIGQIESDHGRNSGPSSAGALGPMQFLPSTWKDWGEDADGDGQANIMDPYDAVYSAARYLCSYGPGNGIDALKRAIFGYNHADWYVDEVLALAVRYR
ncbi:MAG TPA: lytic transglycosylase domain-containing protein [Mycobacteriales bacterium]|nr:lytic transglycosylase domain-containing protein [Mycobacteriales bacterium]